MHLYLKQLLNVFIENTAGSVFEYSIWGSFTLQYSIYKVCMFYVRYNIWFRFHLYFNCIRRLY